MSLQDLLKKAQGGAPSAGSSSRGLQNLLGSSTKISDKTRQLQRDVDAAEFESERINNSFLNKTNRFIDRVNIIPETVRNYKDSFNALPGKYAESIKTGAEEYQRREPLSLAKVGFRMAGDTLEFVFAPISAAIGAVLEASGGAKLVDKTGEYIADKSGITNWPAFQKFAMEHPNAGADFNRLLNLVTLGVVGSTKISPKATAAQVAELSQKVARQVMRPTKPQTGLKRLVVRSETGESQVPLNTPRTRMEKYSQEQGYEPITPDSQLPTIPMGSRPSGDLPTIRYDSPVPSPFLPEGARYEPIRQTLEPTPIQRAAGAPTELIPVGARQAVEGSKASKVATSVQGKAIEKNLASKFDDVAMYEPRTVADQAARVAAIVEDGNARMRRIVRGEEQLPQGVSGSMFIKGVEEYALKTGDAALLRDLARSPLASDTSLYAQELRFLAERDSGSPLAVIKELSDIRASKQKDVVTSKRNTINQIKKEIVQNTPKRQTWESFINSIEC